MLVIRENAEQTCINAIKTSIANKQRKRCIHIHTSRLSPSADFRLSALLDIVRHYIVDEESRVFICEDGDIFILAVGISPELFLEFRSHCAITFDLDSPESFATLHDLGFSADIVVTACEQKRQVLLSQQKRRQKRADTTPERALDLLQLDESLLQTLAARRDKHGKTCVLVVEDDLFSSRMVCNALKDNFNTVTASTGLEGLQAWAKHAPNLIFMDINLPDANGHDLIRRIKQADPTAFIVMLSGNSDRENVLQAMKLGAKGFVAKPFTREKLLQYAQAVPSQ